MRILFIDFTLPYLLKDSEYPVGGWAVELNSWIHGLTANGQDVGVLTWKGANEFVDKDLNFELIETYDPDKGVKVLKYFYYYIPELYRHAKKFKPDVIIQACAGINTGIMAFISKKLKIPFVYRVANDMDTDSKYKNRLLKYQQLLYKYGLSNSNSVLCQNQYQYENIHRKFPDKKISIFYNPFIRSSDTFLKKERKYVAWLGVFQKQKNLPRLYSIAKSTPDIEFRVAGMFGKDVDTDTVRAIDNLKLLPNVKFMGYLTRNKVIPFLSEAICLLNTSLYEGFSNTFLESFSCGTPVIAPREADPDFIILNNSLGFSVEGDEGFSNSIKALVSDKNLFNVLSDNCLRYLKANHDSLKLAREMASFLGELKN